MILKDVAARQRRYEGALRHGLETIPVARQFQELFPDSRNFYSYFRPGLNPPMLNCETTLFNRYWLLLQMRVTFDKGRTRVLGWEEPLFVLTEYVRITRNERFHIEAGGLYRRFGSAEWQKVYEAGGDFSVLGIELIKGKPVPNFAEFWADQKAKT